MNDDIDIERAVRDTLAQRAQQAPPAGPLADRILRQVSTAGPDAARRGWQTWMLPVIAAAAVVVVATVLVAVNHARNTNGHPAAATQPSVTVPSGAPTTVPSTADTGSHSPQSTTPNTSTVPSDFAPLDVTFGSSTDAWVLGAGACPSPSACTPMLIHSTDGGESWSVLPTPPGYVGGSGGCNPQTCLTNVRFADATDGYLFGQNVLYMTHNAGATWQAQPDGMGAEAIETLDGNVIRVKSECQPGCPAVVQTAAIGSTDWTTRSLPGTTPGDGTVLVRWHSDAYILAKGHTAGGAENATSVLFSSTDDGATWASHGEPCPQGGGGPANGEVDSTALTVASDGTLDVECTVRGEQDSFVIRSTDQGGFVRAGSEPLSASGGIFVAEGKQILFAQGDGGVMYRSTDGGATWTEDADFHLVDVVWAGFESDTDGRMVVQAQDQGAQIWTTRDAGAHWSTSSF